MDFLDKLKAIQNTILSRQDQIKNEETAKTSLVLPFIQALGYNIFDPLEVSAEFTADVGTKKGEKVDYAIIKDGVPIILIECKGLEEDLDRHGSQLYRYFSVTKAKFGILTNGIVYRFFTDLDEQNKLDEKPFFEFNLMNVRDSFVRELKKFQKSSFDVQDITSRASELKYANEVRQILEKELTEPTDDFVKFFASQIYPKMVTQKIREQFRPIIKNAAKQYFDELINERLKAALEKEEAETPKTADAESSDQDEAESKKREIETTLEELEGFTIVRTILSEVVDRKRITYKDVVSYFAINLDGKTNKTICRLRFNNPEKKIVSILDENRDEIRKPIDELEDIYKLQDELQKALQHLENDS